MRKRIIGVVAAALVAVGAFAGVASAAVIVGTVGDDFNLAGTMGDDRISGLEGDDLLRGFKGDDRLRGGPGDDVMKGNRGNDVLIDAADNGSHDAFHCGRGALDIARANPSDWVSETCEYVFYPHGGGPPVL